MRSPFRLLCVIYLCLSAEITFAQGTIYFSKCYGGTGSEGANSIIQTSDGGFLFLGGTSSIDGDVSGGHYYYDTINQIWIPGREAWLVKLDSLGNFQWQKCLGGFDLDEGIVLCPTNGGYVVGCTSGSSDGDLTFNNGDADFWIAKIDLFGNLIWQHSYGGSSTENLYSISKCPDGGFVVAGSENSINDGDVIGHHGGSFWDGWLLKLDSLGNLKWQKCIGGTGSELYQQVQTDSLGNIYFVTSTGSTDFDITCNVNGHNIWLCKMDSSGNILWDNCFGGISGYQYIYSMKIYRNKLLLAGRTASADGDLTHNYGYADAWLILTDTSGNKIFSESYGGSLPDVFYSAVLTNDNYIVAGGSTLSQDYDVTNNHPLLNQSECWLVVTDSLGNLIWQNTYGGSGDEEIKSVIALSDSRIIFTGYTTTPNNGDIVDYHGTTAGQTWTVGMDITNTISNIDNNLSVSVYPNPFSNFVYVKASDNNMKIQKINLFNLQEEIIQSIDVNKAYPDLITFEKNLDQGIYILQVISNRGIQNLKLISSPGFSMR